MCESLYQKASLSLKKQMIITGVEDHLTWIQMNRVASSIKIPHWVAKIRDEDTKSELKRLQYNNAVMREKKLILYENDSNWREAKRDWQKLELKRLQYNVEKNTIDTMQSRKKNHSAGQST